MQALSVRPADNACRDAAADRCRDRRTGGGTKRESRVSVHSTLSCEIAERVCSS